MSKRKELLGQHHDAVWELAKLSQMRNPQERLNWGLNVVQAYALAEICNNTGMNVSQLAVTLSRTLSAATRIVDELAGQRLVKQAVSATDRRVHTLRATAKGITLHQRMRQAGMDILATIFAGKRDEEIASYTAVMSELVAGINQWRVNNAPARR